MLTPLQQKTKSPRVLQSSHNEGATCQTSPKALQTTIRMQLQTQKCKLRKQRAKQRTLKRSRLHYKSKVQLLTTHHPSPRPKFHRQLKLLKQQVPCVQPHQQSLYLRESRTTPLIQPRRDKGLPHITSQPKWLRQRREERTVGGVLGAIAVTTLLITTASYRRGSLYRSRTRTIRMRIIFS